MTKYLLLIWLHSMGGYLSVPGIADLQSCLDLAKELGEHNLVAVDKAKEAACIPYKVE